MICQNLTKFKRNVAKNVYYLLIHNPRKWQKKNWIVQVELVSIANGFSCTLPTPEAPIMSHSSVFLSCRQTDRERERETDRQTDREIWDRLQFCDVGRNILSHAQMLPSLPDQCIARCCFDTQLWVQQVQHTMPPSILVFSLRHLYNSHFIMFQSITHWEVTVHTTMQHG